VTVRGKVALIVGASGAIGSAIAHEFAREGAAVALASRLSSVSGLVKQIGATGARCMQVEMDVTCPETIARAIGAVERGFGSVEILVNATGAYGPIGPVEQNDPAHWARAVEINVTGAFNVVHAILPSMLQGRTGRIVHFSGGGGAYGRPFFSSYSACKAAIVRFTECIAMELKDKNIYVNVIAPGPVKSAMWEELRAASSLAGEDALRELNEMDATGGVSAQRAARLALMLAGTPVPITGRLISVVWDDWEHLDQHFTSLLNSDTWTLRRVSIGGK